MIFKQVAFLIIIAMLSSCAGVSQPHHVNGHSALYIDSVRGFAFSPFYGKGGETTLGFLDARNETSTIIFITDTTETKDAFSTRKAAIVGQGTDLALDTTFSVAGNDAVIYGYRVKLRGSESNCSELRVLTPFRVYREMAIRPALRQGYSREDIPGVLTYLDFEQKDSRWANPIEKPKMILVDSTLKFSFAPHQEDRPSDSLDGFAMFYGPTDQGITMAGQIKKYWTLEGWREHQRKILEDQGTKVILDSTINVNGREGILWRYSTSFKGMMYPTLVLSIIGNDRVYMVISACEEGEFASCEGLFLRAFQSFRVLR